MAEKTTIGEVLLRNVRLSFAHLLKPSDDSIQVNKTTGEKTTIKGSYQARFLMEKGSTDGEANVQKIKKAARDVKSQPHPKGFGADESKWPKIKPDRVCLRDGDLEDWDGYEGNWYLAANSPVDRPPQIITNRKDADGKWIPAEAGKAGNPFSGCYVNALVRLWVQNHETYGKRINASLEVVQYLRDGPAFGAAPVDPNERFTDDMVGSEGSIGGDEEDDDDLI